MYHRVYSPNGEPFDVPRERADRLILQEGWTQTPPKAIIPEPEIVQEAVQDTVEQPRQRNRKRKASSDLTSDE